MEIPRQEVEHTDEERLASLAARRAVRKVRAEAGTTQFGRLLAFQAAGAAGDALIALALAGSLFFSVPETTARLAVGRYLLLTVAPFAVVAPLLSRALDPHRGSLKVSMALAAIGRGSLAWMLATRLDSVLLYPIAFGLLVLSRAALVMKGAILPGVIPEGRSLVQANSSLSKATAVAGVVVVPIGLLLIGFVGSGAELLFAAIVYYVGGLPPLRLPSGRGRRPLGERIEARAATRSTTVRQALIAAGGMRFLVGFLIFHLAFALRREHFGTVGLGLLIGAAAAGAFLGALVAPRLRSALIEEGILAVTLAVGGLAAVISGRWFTLVSAIGLVLVFGTASGASKLAFDAVVQRETPEAARGWAFARFESALQLAWVAGAILPLALSVPSGPGVIAGGIVANLLALMYVLARRRAHGAAGRRARTPSAGGRRRARR